MPQARAHRACKASRRIRVHCQSFDVKVLCLCDGGSEQPDDDAIPATGGSTAAEIDVTQAKLLEFPYIGIVEIRMAGMILPAVKAQMTT